MKKKQIKSSFPSENSLAFLILAHVLRHNNKNTYLQTMFAATQQIASIAGLKVTKVQVRFTSSSLLFDLYPSCSSRWGGRWRWEMMNPSSKMFNISFDARALVRCNKCSRNAPNMNERAHVHPFLLYVRVLSRIVCIVHPFSPRLYFQTKIARIPFEILVVRYALVVNEKRWKKTKNWECKKRFLTDGSFSSFS